MNNEITALTKWVIIFVEFNLIKLLNINSFYSVQQRYVLALMMFLGLGVTFALRLSFSLILTQMVYIPNANENNKTADSNGELVCPIKYEYLSQNETTTSSVRKKFTALWKKISYYFFHICLLS